MRRRSASALLIGLVAAGGMVGAGGCTDTSLQPAPTPRPAALDDKLTVTARLCTAPSVDDFFPVKILVLVDTSDSMSVTDRGGLRAQAVVDLLNRYSGNPSVKFGVIAFDSKIDVLTDGFTNSPNIGKISQRLAMADRLTDYQGALGTAYTMLSEDMIASPRAERPRTKYVVIFFSDGTPDPQCSAKGPNPFLVCSVPRERWQDAFDPPIDPAIYPELQAGGDYNQPAQILQKIDQIVALEDFYRVGEVRVHGAFLFDPKAAQDPLAKPFRLDRKAGIALLTEVAAHGHGTFTEFDSSTKISFLQFGYSALKAPYELAGFFATSAQALPRLVTPAVDTDGDGLDDTTEFSLRTCVGRGPGCADPTDSDGDGYTDFVEVRQLRAGFDPTDPKRPSARCTAPADSDGDGLRDCEEGIYGSDPRLLDTDADRIPDGVEVRAGLDPTLAGDALADPDHDGVRSGDEIRAHTDPLLPDQAGRPADSRYGYDVFRRATGFGDSACYDLVARDIRLLNSGAGTESLPGRNRVLLYFTEALKDRPQDFGLTRIACLDTRFVNGAFKSPPSGHVELSEKNFVPAGRWRASSDCLDLTNWQPSPDDGGSADGGARDAR